MGAGFRRKGQKSYALERYPDLKEKLEKQQVDLLLKSYVDKLVARAQPQKEKSRVQGVLKNEKAENLALRS